MHASSNRVCAMTSARTGVRPRMNSIVSAWISSSSSVERQKMMACPGASTHVRRSQRAMSTSGELGERRQDDRGASRRSARSLWIWYLNEPNANRLKMVAKTSPATSANGIDDESPAGQHARGNDGAAENESTAGE